MTKVVIRREGGVTIEADLTFEQFKELAGVNGHGSSKGSQSATLTLQPGVEPNFPGFLQSLSERGKHFVRLLQFNPNGIEAFDLARELGYQDPKQIGGLTGGGLAKIAKTHHVKLKDVYRTEITFPEGKRKVTFYPGKFILAFFSQTKPAV